MESDGNASAPARWLYLYLGSVFFLMAVGNLGLVSIMPAIGRTLDIPDYLIACVFSFSALAWAVSSPFWVRRVSRRGPALFIRAGILAFILSMGGFALGIELGRLGWVAPFGIFLIFFVLRATFGLFGSGTATAVMSIVTLNAQGADRTRILTEMQGANNLGSVIGPAVAPFLIVAPLGLIGPILGFSLFGALAFLSSFIFLRGRSQAPVEAAPGEQASSLSAVWRRKEIGRHLTFGMVISSAQAINLYMIGFVLIDRMPGDALAAQNLIALAMTGGAIAALVAQFGVSRLVRISPGLMMFLGAVFALAGNVLPLAHAGPYMTTWGFLVASFGYGLARPGFAAAASLSGLREDQVAIASAVSMIAGASIAVPPIIAAAAYQVWTPVPFALPAILAAILLLNQLSWHLRHPGIVHRKQ